MKTPKLAALVLGSSDKDDDEKGAANEGDEEVDDFDEVADELFDALKSGNKTEFRQALKACLKSC